MNDKIQQYFIKLEMKRWYRRNLFCKRSSLPWINENVIQMMRERGDRALQTSLKSKRITDRHIFTALRNKVTREFRKAKANYFLEIIVNSKGDSKQIWQQIKKLIGQNNVRKQIELRINDSLSHDPLMVAEMSMSK